MRILLCLALIFSTLPAFAAGFGPWDFGMSVEQVLAIRTHGPYRAFSNGDLETDNADFGGEARNFQFYFEDGRLRRIAIRTYEGKDLVQATQAWRDTYIALKSLHGPVETPDLVGASLDELANSAMSTVANSGKAQMAPVSQPEGAFVFSSFNSFRYQDTTYYMVTVNYDPLSPQ
ncbi:TPA: hypothetical protein NKO30_006741 [Pseudomonas aeruginosa]|nr:hypothetical protein [Pseudomonas aeruginosa]